MIDPLPEYPYQQIIHALDRQIASLDYRAKELSGAKDYGCMFFKDDADQLREARRLLLATSLILPSCTECGSTDLALHSQGETGKLRNAIQNAVDKIEQWQSGESRQKSINPSVIRSGLAEALGPPFIPKAGGPVYRFQHEGGHQYCKFRKMNRSLYVDERGGEWAECYPLTDTEKGD